VTRLLVVDDEADIRLLTRLILESAGYEVLEAASGEAALALLREEPVDLVILDIRMSGMDGWEVISALGNQSGTPPVRILAFSAHVEERVLSSALERGCVGALVKPFTPEECLAAVRAALDKAVPR
jgi:CheY-like chemotaxis protein